MTPFQGPRDGEVGRAALPNVAPLLRRGRPPLPGTPLLTLALATILCALSIFALWGLRSSADEEANVSGELGSHVPGLTGLEEDIFEIGKRIFRRRFTREDGLGPHFNASSCLSCHETPVVGGSSQRYRDFFLLGKQLENGTTPKYFPDCTSNMDRSSTLCLPSLVVPHYGPAGTTADPVAASVEHPGIPAAADAVVARRNAPPIFGIGLFRFVGDAEILARADPDDSNHDGISGRVNRIPSEDNAIGRFGYKCQAASIEGFNRGALMNQMGITSDSTASADVLEVQKRSLIEELLGTRTAFAQVPAPKDRLTDFDDTPDPEISRTELSHLVFFQENLAAPARGPITRSVLRGEEVFGRIGCAACHTPSLGTLRGVIHPYTDLLIHDMGPELADGIVMAAAQSSEFRTQPLWGLCHHAPFLHDGRADTVDEAVRLHGGEGQAASSAYAALSPSEQADLLRFLESL